MCSGSLPNQIHRWQSLANISRVQLGLRVGLGRHHLHVGRRNPVMPSNRHVWRCHVLRALHHDTSKKEPVSILQWCTDMLLWKGTFPQIYMILTYCMSHTLLYYILKTCTTLGCILIFVRLLHTKGTFLLMWHYIALSTLRDYRILMSSHLKEPFAICCSL